MNGLKSPGLAYIQDKGYIKSLPKVARMWMNLKALTSKA